MLKLFNFQVKIELNSIIVDNSLIVEISLIVDISQIGDTSQRLLEVRLNVVVLSIMYEFHKM